MASEQWKTWSSEGDPCGAEMDMVDDERHKHLEGEHLPPSQSQNKLGNVFVTASQLLHIQAEESPNSDSQIGNCSNSDVQHHIAGPKRRKIHMDMKDCLDFTGSEEGATALKHPNIVKTSSKDPNRGLYPRLPSFDPGAVTGFTKASNLMGPSFGQFNAKASSGSSRRKNLAVESGGTIPGQWSLQTSPKPKSGPARKLKAPPQRNTMDQYFNMKRAAATESQSNNELGSFCGSQAAQVESIGTPGISTLEHTGFSVTQPVPRTASTVRNTTNFLSQGSKSQKSYQFTTGESPTKKVVMFSPVKQKSDGGCVYVIDSSPESSLKSSQESSSSSTTSVSAHTVTKRLFDSQKSVISEAGKSNSSLGRKSKSSQGKSAKASKKPAPRFNRDNTFLYSNDPIPSPSNQRVMASQTGPKDKYGMLGNGNRLTKSDAVETDFCYFDLLPVEVIENIFCMMPMMDLCLNVNMVCTQWHDIISNPKFLPWKKRYHKVKLQIESSIAEVVSIMTKNDMTSDESYLPGLLRYMKEFKPVTATNMLQCLERHRKYGWVENLLTERLSECFHHELPNPWCVVTGLVFVSENVGDVQEIISCLLGSNSQCTAAEVLECLYCISLFLHVFKTFKFRDIWNRLHYLVYYALYLFENTSCTTSSQLNNALSSGGGQQSLLKYSSGDTSMRMTHEQLRICNHDMRYGDIVKIIAFAGTGKTTTLVRYTQLRPNKRFLLVVYNKSVCEHAKTKFPANVECKTGHALAFATVGRRYAANNKLAARLKIMDIIDHFKATKGESLYVQAKFIIDALSNFMASEDQFITTAHVPNEKVDDKGIRKPVEHEIKMHIVKSAEHIWQKMIDLKDRSIRITHDTYLKLYHLSKPNLKKYDIVLIDEAQDLTPAIADILLSQSQAKLLVGDPHQQIYSFRGAVNAMQQVEATHTFYLTQSFRFGPEIAYVASSCLEMMKGERKKTLVGNGIPGGIRGEQVGQLAIITRCNFTLFNEAVKRCCYNDDKTKVAFVGGTQGFGFNMILDIYTLMLSPEDRIKERRSIENPFIRRFPSFNELEKFALKTMDSELLGKIRIVKTHHSAIPSHVNKILSRAISDLDTADVVLSTAHKAKGLEFSTVRLTDDFSLGPIQIAGIQLQRGQQQVTDSVDESNLLYVAVTRAKKRLQISPTLRMLLHMVGENFKYPVCTKLLQQENTPMKCMETDRDFEPCALTLVQRPVKMGDGLERPGGLICPQVISEEYSGIKQLLGSLKDERVSADSEQELPDEESDE